MKILRFVLPIVIVSIISLPALWELLQPGYYTNHDGEGHIIRLEEFHRAIQDGHFPVRWSKRLLYGYGYPFFNFNYPLAYYSGEVWRILGFNATDSIKLVFALSFVASGIIMYFWQQNLWGTSGALTATLLYLYAPYRFVNLYVRGSLAEHLAFMFAPFVFWMTTRIAHSRHRLVPIIVGAFAYGGLMLSHNISAFLVSFLLGSYFLFLVWAKRNIRLLFPFTGMVFLGLALSAYFWIPAILEKSNTLLDQTIGRDYPDHFLALWQLFMPTWDFGGSVRGINDGLSFQLGIAHILIYILAVVSTLWFLPRDRPHKYLATFFMAATILGILFMLPITKFIWDRAPLLPFTQFPWRFLMWTTLTIAICGGFLGGHISKLKLPLFIHRAFLPTTFTVFLWLLLLGLDWNYMKVNQLINVTVPKTEWLSGTTTWADEQTPKWLHPKPTQAPLSRIETDRSAAITALAWKTQEHHYTIQTNNPTTVTEHTAYYPGWKVWVNGNETPIDYTSKESGGKLRFFIPAGAVNVESRLTETPLRTAVDLISLFTAILLFFALFFHFYLGRVRPKSFN